MKQRIFVKHVWDEIPVNRTRNIRRVDTEEASFLSEVLGGLTLKKDSDCLSIDCGERLTMDEYLLLKEDEKELLRSIHIGIKSSVKQNSVLEMTLVEFIKNFQGISDFELVGIESSR